MISRRKILTTLLAAPVAVAGAEVVPAAAPLLTLKDLNKATLKSDNALFVSKEQYDALNEELRKAFGSYFAPADCFTWVNSKTAFKVQVFGPMNL